MTAARQRVGARGVGIFRVTVDAQAVAIFAAALGRADAIDVDTSVPLTFPLRWFSDPAIRAALVAATHTETLDESEAPMLPVHIEQRIALSEPLRVGAAYRLAFSLEGPDERRMLRITAALSDSQGEEVGLLTSGFLMVSTDSGDTSVTWHR